MKVKSSFGRFCLIVLILDTCLGVWAFSEETKVVRGSVEWQQNIIARNIYREGRGEGTNGMYVVGCIVQQRSIDWRLNPADVCLQPRQFSCWNKATEADKEFRALPRCPEADYAQTLAKAIVNGQTLDRKSIGFANHYCRVDCHPKWANGVKPVAVVGEHQFFKL